MSNTTNDRLQQQDHDDAPDFRGLLGALANFARAAQRLPETEELMEYESSFPEFQTALSQAQQSLVAVMGNTVQSEPTKKTTMTSISI